MLRIRAIGLYTALCLTANPVLAGGAAEALRDGDMKKLNFLESPAPLPLAALVDGADRPVDLALWQGKWVVLNFWATWCAPCREEMPSLAELQTAMPGIAVLPVATGRNPLPAIEKFFAEAGVENLPIIRDPKSDLAHGIGVMGLPVTLIVNPEGQEVARLIGGADWNSESARAVIAALVAGQ
jgi:thiol-disulfide isomerase/thioredoxin